ncbi:hypothetical protein [Prosthecobacter sp.]|uniref:hypothetical protein n=1 Tax=Prosthecobacter sp. TaxID=1965333 RepID=UPI003784233E
MKTVLRLFAAVLLASVLTACPETLVDEDFGLKPAVLKAADWNGAWLPVDDDDVLKFEVTDAAQGLVVMTEPGKKDGKPVEFHLRRATGDAKTKLLFAVARERGEKKAGPSLFLMREADDGVLYTWSLDHEAVAAAIRAGTLQGTVKMQKDDPHNHVDSTAGNYAKLLEPGFWRWSEPTCLKRVRGK